MKLLSELLKSLATKAGVRADDDNLKKLLDNDFIKQYEVPDEVAGPLEQRLLTEDSAVVNPMVKSKLYAQALNGIDAELERVVDAFDFSDDFKSAYKSIDKNTNEKVRKLTDGLKSKVSELKKSKTSGDPDSKAMIGALENQIKDLNKSQEDLKRMHATELDNMKMQNTTDKKNYLLKSMLAGKPLPKNGLKAEINIQLAKTLLEDEMAKKHLLISFDEAGNPVLKEKKDGAEIPYFFENKPMDLSNFLDGVLAQNNFLQINDQNDASGSNGYQQAGQQQSNGNNQGQSSQQPLKNQAAANEAMAKAKE